MEFTIIEDGGGIFLKPANTVSRTSLDQVVGCIPFSGRAKSIEEMDVGIRRKVQERRGRRRH